MLNPKYAGLPWIAVDEKDTYETSDLPEVDQAATIQVDNSDNVHVYRLNPEKAYGMFQGKALSANDVDFEDCSKMGYSSHYQKRQETLTEKIDRMRIEMGEVQDELNTYREEAKSVDLERIQDVASLMQSVEDHMRHLKLNERFVNDRNSMFDAGAFIGENVLQQLRATASSNESETMRKGTSSEGVRMEGDTNPRVVYELYQSSKVTDSILTGKYQDLESRIGRLELLLTSDGSQNSTSSDCLEKQGLIKTVNSLTSRLNLLDPQHLEVIEPRLNNLFYRLQSIAEKKETVANADSLSKINELYTLIKKYEGIAASIPHVVERLECLQLLHEQAGQFAQTLRHMDAAQTDMDETVKTHRELLDNLKSNFTAKVMELSKTMEEIRDQK